jgi:hypothetical protein
VKVPYGLNLSTDRGRRSRGNRDFPYPGEFNARPHVGHSNAKCFWIIPCPHGNRGIYGAFSTELCELCVAAMNFSERGNDSQLFPRAIGLAWATATTYIPR